MRRTIMAYSSIPRPFIPKFFINKYMDWIMKWASKTNSSLALGFISKGVYGIEPTYGPESLKIEIYQARAQNINEVVIFHLSGLNESYAEVLN